MARKSPYEKADKEHVRELKIYEENNSDLYFRSKKPIYQNLDKKVEKGTYDGKKSLKLWDYHSKRTADAYEKEFGSGSKIFSVADRKALSKELKEEYEMDRGLK
jgi:hypothetical protein